MISCGDESHFITIKTSEQNGGFETIYRKRSDTKRIVTE